MKYTKWRKFRIKKDKYDMHIFLQNTLFKCNICRRFTSNKCNMERHILNHTENQNYKNQINSPLDFMEKCGNIYFYSKKIIN
jgi:hypothetical protein